MYELEEKTIRLRPTILNHQWAMEMMEQPQLHHRDGKDWVVIQVSTRQTGLFVRLQEFKTVKITVNPKVKTMTTEIEKTKRALFDSLETIKGLIRGNCIPSTNTVDKFESCLEEYLEEYHKFEYPDMKRRLAEMTEERDAIQLRLHAIDHAFCEQSNTVSRMADEIDRHKVAINIAGEELIRVQGIARQHLDDCRSAEKLSDELSEKLTHATTVIGQQEQLIAGQRSAIAGMHAELTHSRTIRKALKCAQGAFRSMDEALHGSKVWSAQKALADDVVDAEFQA